MRNLPETHSAKNEAFMLGKFSVKRTKRCYNAVGADKCLEQTINRSQKGQGGIISNTKRKEFVVKWEITHYEKLAISNLIREVTGVSNWSSQLNRSIKLELSTKQEYQVGALN